MSYRIEVSPNNRAGCKDAVCKKEGKKITKGEIRFGTWVTIMEHASWQWRHWGCVSGEQIKNLREGIDRDGSFDFEMIDGWEDLEDHPDVREKIKRVVNQGHIDPEDFNGDPEMNKLGQKGIRGRAKKAKPNDEDGEPSSSAPKTNKRGRKKAAAEDDGDDEEDAKPKKKTKKAAAKTGDDADVKPATKGRGKKAAVKAEDIEDEKPAAKGRGKKAAVKAEDIEDEKPATRGRGKKATTKAAVREESEEELEPEEEEKPAPVKKTRGRKAAVKKEPTPNEEEDEVEDEEMEEKSAPKPKVRGGRKANTSAAATEDAAPTRSKRGRGRTSAAADDEE